MIESKRLMTGAVIRADKEWLAKNGLADQVRARLPPDSAALLDKPPLPITWIPARHVDDLLEAVLAIAGEEKLLQLAEEVTRSSFGPVVRPLLRTLMSLFGASPGSLLGKLDTVLPVFLRGASFTYEPQGEKQGTLRLRTVDQPARAWLLQWRGTLRFGFEIAKVTGSIDSCIVDADGKGASYSVRWS